MIRSQEPESLTIGKLAATNGVGVETIRFYQRKGLLETPARDSGVRRYGPTDIRRLRFIRQAQSAGFTLEQIRELLELDFTTDRKRARELAEARILALEERMAELRAARNSLRRLASECGESSSGPCPILSAFDDQSSRSRSLK